MMMRWTSTDSVDLGADAVREDAEVHWRRSPWNGEIGSDMGRGTLVTRVQASYEYAPADQGMFGARSVRALSGTNVYVCGLRVHLHGHGVRAAAAVCVEIDLDVRVRGNDTFVGFDDVSGRWPSVSLSRCTNERAVWQAREGSQRSTASVSLSISRWARASLKAEDVSSKRETDGKCRRTRLDVHFWRLVERTFWGWMGF